MQNTQPASYESLSTVVSSNPQLIGLLTPKLTDYIPIELTAKQHAFLLLDCKDAFYGGAAGGGKSVALLAAALQYVDAPGYSALLIRDTFQNLSKPDGLMELATDWLSGTKAHWNGEKKRWEFPTDGKAAFLSFGYLDGPRDHLQYKSAAYQYVGIDESVDVRKNQALYLFSRLRRLKTQKEIPIRFRCASNPPEREMVVRGAWVKERYVDPKTKKKEKIFIPAKMDDNPHLDKEEYRKALAELDPVTRRQLEEGDWEIKAKGRMFQREWFPVVQRAPANFVKVVRYWDLAATDEVVGEGESNQPAYSAGCKMLMTEDGLYFITSIIRDQLSPRKVEALVRQTADIDKIGVPIWMEQEPGASGKSTISHYRRNILKGYEFRGDPVGKAKEKRWGPFASAAEAGNVLLLAGHWNEDFLDEMELVPEGFKDQADAASGAHQKLSGIGTEVTPNIRLV